MRVRERERERDACDVIDITLKSRVIMHIITSTARGPYASTRSEPVECSSACKAWACFFDVSRYPHALILLVWGKKQTHTLQWDQPRIDFVTNFKALSVCACFQLQKKKKRRKKLRTAMSAVAFFLDSE